MADEDVTAQIAAVRRDIARAVPNHIDAKTVELAAFTATGRGELGLRVWQQAADAAKAARRSKGKALRARFGARNPNGWLSFVALAGALSAAVAAVLTSGFRFDPEETSATTAVLASLAAAASLIVLVVAAGKPLNRSMIRIHGVLTVGVVVAAALMVSRGIGAPAVVVAVSALMSVVGYAVIFVARARNPEGTELIDTAINVALADTHPEVQAMSWRLQSQVAEELGAGDSERIVMLRTTVLTDLASEGVALEPTDARAPAGSIIINELIGTWVSAAQRGEVPPLVSGS